MTKNKLVIANWKANPESYAKAKEIAAGIKISAARAKNLECVVCPPMPYLGALASVGQSKSIKWGAQDFSVEDGGAHTGSVTVKMLKDLGVQYAVIGHSEKREMGDTDELINKKVKTVLAVGIKAVLCVGERERDEHGVYLSFVEKQLVTALSGVKRSDANNIVVAYEPIWAIGVRAARVATSVEIEETILYLRKILVNILGKDGGQKVRVLYGGSVDMKNVSEIIKIPHVDGMLVGRESLNPKNFAVILNTTSQGSTLGI